jgi:hypothetical protein
MNLRELGRVTTPSLPNKGDTLPEVIDKVNNCLKELYRRDSDKEQRIRVLEGKVK